MNKHLKRGLIAVIVIMTILSVTTQFIAATIYQQDGFLYSMTSYSTADLYGRESTDADLVIPKEFNEHYVTNIIDSAFNGDENIVTLSFGKATLLQRIGYYAFADCANLSGTVIFSGRINTLGISAFQNCTSLEGVRIISRTITVIPEQCFYNCTSLSDVQLSDRVTRIDKYAFANTALSEITIPKSVTSIDSTAFDGCEELVINCYYNSYAAQYAEENGIDYVILDPPEPPTEPATEPPTEPVTEPVTEPETEPATEPVTQPATEPATEPKSYYLLGDVDGDGIVDITDVTFIRRDDISLPVPDEYIMLHGDVDGDNVVSVMDATAIMRWNIGLYVPYAVGERVYLES